MTSQEPLPPQPAIEAPRLDSADVLAALPAVERLIALIDTLCAALLAESAPRTRFGAWFGAVFGGLARPVTHPLVARIREMLRGISDGLRTAVAAVQAGAAEAAGAKAGGAKAGGANDAGAVADDREIGAASPRCGPGSRRAADAARKQRPSRTHPEWREAFSDAISAAPGASRAVITVRTATTPDEHGFGPIEHATSAAFRTRAPALPVAAGRVFFATGRCPTFAHPFHYVIATKHCGRRGSSRPASVGFR